MLGRTRRRRGWAAINDDAGRAFSHGGFTLRGRLVFYVVEPGQIILDFEHIGLPGADAAGDAADRAHRARDFTGFPAAAGHRHHIFRTERHHLDKVSRARP